MQHEAKFEKDFINELGKLGPMWVAPKDIMPTVRGTPDRLVCFNGVFLALEFKKTSKEKGKPRAVLQRHVLKKIEECGGVGLVVYPENRRQEIDTIVQRCL